MYLLIVVPIQNPAPPEGNMWGGKAHHMPLVLKISHVRVPKGARHGVDCESPGQLLEC